MARSRWKLKYFSNSVWRKIVALKKNKRLRRRILYDRASDIPKCFKSFTLRVHKGRGLRRLLINYRNIGKKFGEFSFTRKPFYYPNKKAKKKKNLLLRK